MNYLLRWLIHANRKVLVPLAICLGCAVLIAGLYHFNFDSLVKLDSYQLNSNVMHGRKIEPDPRLIFLAINRSSYEGEILDDDLVDSPILAAFRQPYPWPRAVWAAVIERLMEAHVQAVALDMLFIAPKDGDDALKAVLEKYRDRVVIGCNFQMDQVVSGDRVGNNLTLSLPSVTLVGQPDGSGVSLTDPRIGFVNQWPDDDGVIRQSNFSITREIAHGAPPPAVSPKEFPGTMWSLMARVAQKIHQDGNLPDSWDGQLIRYCNQPGLTFPAHPVYEIFLPNIWEKNYHHGESLRDKIVVIGTSGDWSHDEHQTPFVDSPLMAGAEIHLNVLSTILRHNYLHKAPRWVTFVLIFFAGLLAFAESRCLTNSYVRISVGLLTIVAFGAASFISYDSFDTYLLIMSPVVAFFTGLVGTYVYEIVFEQYERSRMRGVLDRYMSKDLVKDVLDNPHSYFTTVGGVRKPVTVLFSDVRGFTTIAEGADPSDLVKQLNEYLTEMVKIVFHHTGTLDKFIGDAVMAVWGSVVSGGPAADAGRAVRAALEMRAGLARLNASWRDRGMMELSFGIGINHGEVVVGNIGSQQKMEITVIGDAVNLASRLESLTKEYQLDLLIGENVAALIEKEFYLQLADNVRVKGKSRPVRVFAVLAERAAIPDPTLENYLEYYHAGLALYQKGEFAHASLSFATAHGVLQPNGLAKIYLARCEQLLINHPEHWDGVYVMTKK